MLNVDLTDSRVFIRTAFCASSARHLSDFANMVGITLRTLTNWHSGIKLPRRNNLLAIAHFIRDTTDQNNVEILYSEDRLPLYVFDSRFYLRSVVDGGISKPVMMGLEIGGAQNAITAPIPFIERVDIPHTEQNTSLIAKIESWVPQC